MNESVTDHRDALLLRPLSQYTGNENKVNFPIRENAYKSTMCRRQWFCSYATATVHRILSVSACGELLTLALSSSPPSELCSARLQNKTWQAVQAWASTSPGSGTVDSESSEYASFGWVSFFGWDAVRRQSLTFLIAGDDRAPARASGRYDKWQLPSPLPLLHSSLLLKAVASICTTSKCLYTISGKRLRRIHFFTSVCSLMSVCVPLFSVRPQVHRGRDSTESEHIQTNADGQRGCHHQRRFTHTTSVSHL